MDFYRNEAVTEHITRIRAFWNDACVYYVRGEKSGLLIDTGYGFGDLKAYVDELAGQPYEVVLSHGHLDHANGAGQWESVYMSHKDIDLYRQFADIASRKNFLSNYVKNLDTYSDSLYVPVYDREFLDLKDGDTFDLGGVCVETIAAPGHTQGMMTFLVREDRTILFGDACGVFTLFVMPEASSLEEFMVSMEKLKSRETEYDRILRQHGTCESPKSLLDEDIAIVQSILDGTDDHEPFVFNGIDCFIARAVDPITKRRRDGKEGNILYIPAKIRAEK